MSASSPSLALAERAERLFGPRVALPLYRKVADRTTGELGAHATAHALRCASAASDGVAFADLTRAWAKASPTLPGALVIELCKAEWRKGEDRWPLATSLARAETERRPDARVWYMYARCLEALGDDGAAESFRTARAHAEREGALDLAHAASARRVGLLLRRSGALREAIAEARTVDPARLDEASKLVVARALLRAPSRFVRASGLGLLDDLVTNGSPPSADDALFAVALHADDLGSRLSPLEEERISAIFTRPTVATWAAGARDIFESLVRFHRATDPGSRSGNLSELLRHEPTLEPLVRRARDVASGRFEARGVAFEHDGSAHPMGPPGSPFDALYDAVVALRDRAFPHAALALARLASREPRARPLPALTWIVIERGLLSGDGAVAREAARLCECMMHETLSGARGPLPAHGYLPIAEALTGSDRPDLAEAVLRCAVTFAEPGALDRLVVVLLRSAWRLAAAGERPRAIDKLREARALASSAG